jgi:hypothetical protein
MNEILREEFVNLHSQPLLENLRGDFWLRHPDVDLPKMPELGDLGLQVMHSYLQQSSSLINTLTRVGITVSGQLFRIFNFNKPGLLHRP